MIEMHFYKISFLIKSIISGRSEWDKRDKLIGIILSYAIKFGPGFSAKIIHVYVPTKF